MAEEKNNRRGRIARMTDSVKRLFSRKHDESEPRVMLSGRDDVATPIRTEREQPHARATRREADIPFEQLNQTYSPTQTSLKAGFRADGADLHRDQEFAAGAGVDRWNDEDHYTNKSGDPRIGTHRRSYEPGERDTLPDNE
ncbi:MAG TPA: hypothetical protein VH087_06880 [Thermoanaerobaculia bacterium]|jgi:hypothetical protein|nr:hypothetical protein [Thermoanaerobaculia bacterium]